MTDVVRMGRSAARVDTDRGLLGPSTAECTVDDLAIEGRLPDGLRGRFLRIGPEPRSGARIGAGHATTGAAMVHEIRIVDGRAHYRNRWISGDGADAPNSGLVAHEGRLYALGAHRRPVRLDDLLVPMGDDALGATRGSGAHAHVDPVWDELVVVEAAPTESLLSITTIDVKGRVRRVAFAQLALLGEPELDAAMLKPEDELGRLSRALPLWLAETFHVSPHYAASAVVGLHASGGVKRPFLFNTEWTSENLTQLVNTSSDPLDYVITGALRHKAGDYELVLRVWEVKKFRERKQFTARWAPADAGQALAKLHEQVRSFMEWSAAPGGLPYAVPADPRAWLEVLGAGAGLFLATKGLVPRELLPPTAPVFAALANQTAASPSASLAWLTLRDRVKALGDEALPADAVLSADALVTRAQEILGG